MGKRIKSKREIRKRYQRGLEQPQDLSPTYIDTLGYYRFCDTNLLVHRVIARKIWEKNPDRYPLPFGSYTVHHKDGVKSNNRPANLAILTAEDHAQLHPHIRDNGDPLKKFQSLH